MNPVVGRRLSVVGKGRLEWICDPSGLAQQFLTTLLLLLLLLCGCTSKPPLRVSISENSALINVETLDEYGTSVVHVRLENTQTRSTVWELKANSGEPVLHAFGLREGGNPASLQPQGGTYEVVMPADSNVFRLDRGVEYELSLWKKPDSSPAHAKIQFTK